MFSLRNTIVCAKQFTEVLNSADLKGINFKNQVRFTANNITRPPVYRFKYPRDPRQPKNLEEYHLPCTEICNNRIFPPSHLPINFLAIKQKPRKLYKLNWPKDPIR